MTDDDIRALWASMRPVQGDPDPVAFARAVLWKTKLALASALGWPGGIHEDPPDIVELLQLTGRLRVEQATYADEVRRLRKAIEHALTDGDAAAMGALARVIGGQR